MEDAAPLVSPSALLDDDPLGMLRGKNGPLNGEWQCDVVGDARPPAPAKKPRGKKAAAVSDAEVDVD